MLTHKLSIFAIFLTNKLSIFLRREVICCLKYLKIAGLLTRSVDVINSPQRSVIFYPLQIKRNSFSMHKILFGITVICFVFLTRATAQKVELAIDVSKSGMKIDRNIFGQ